MTPAPFNDRWVVRIVVASMSVTALGALVLMGFLALTHTPIPDQIDRAFTFSFGGLVGVLATTRSGSNDELVDQSAGTASVSVQATVTPTAPDAEVGRVPGPPPLRGPLG